MGLQGLMQKQLSTLGCLRQTQLLGIAVAVAAVVTISAQVFLSPEETQKELWLPSPDLLQHPARPLPHIPATRLHPTTLVLSELFEALAECGAGTPLCFPLGCHRSPQFEPAIKATPSMSGHPFSIQAMAQCLPTIHPCLFSPQQDSAFRLACLPLRVSGGVCGLDCPTPSHVPAL